MDDAELIRALLEQRDGALDELQTAYGPLLRYIIAPILPDPSDREECLSDVLMQVWQSIGSYDSQLAALSTWLAALARNAALNRRRANVRRQTVPLNETVPDPAEGPEQAALRSELASAIRRAVAELPGRDRALFLRKYHYYQSTAQIAAELGLTERAVEGRLYRIRRRLQKELGGDWHD